MTINLHVLQQCGLMVKKNKKQGHLTGRPAVNTLIMLRKCRALKEEHYIVVFN